LAELISKGVAEFYKRIFLADRAFSIRFLAVVFRCPHEIRIGIAGIDDSTKECKQGRALIK
jgi:hypothetical protein